MPGLEIDPGTKLSAHAAIQIADRKVKSDWLLTVLRTPEFVRDDARRPGVKLAFGRIPQFGDRWLRVAYVERASGIVIVTAMYDRTAEKFR
jgi:hypothetical protein